MARFLRLAVAIGLLAALVVGTGTVAAANAATHKILDTRLVGLAVPRDRHRRRDRRRSRLDDRRGQRASCSRTAGS